MTSTGPTTSSTSPTPTRWHGWKNRLTPDLSNLRQRIGTSRWPSRSTRSGRNNRTGTLSPAMTSAFAVFVLTWIGTSVVTLSYPSVPGGGVYGSLAIALAFGIALAVATFIAGPNGQVNPAEATALSLRGGDRSGLKLILPMLGGAIAASVVVRVGFGSLGMDFGHLGAAVPSVSNGLTAGVVAIFLAEFVGTFLLTFCGRIVNQFDIIHPLAKLASRAVTNGMVLAGCLFAVLTVSGGALNPARLLGPFIVTVFSGGSFEHTLAGTILNSFGYLLIYLTAQLAGAYVGVGRVANNAAGPHIVPATTSGATS